MLSWASGPSSSEATAETPFTCCWIKRHRSNNSKSFLSIQKLTSSFYVYSDTPRGLDTVCTGIPRPLTHCESAYLAIERNAFFVFFFFCLFVSGCIASGSSITSSSSMGSVPSLSGLFPEGRPILFVVLPHQLYAAIQ